MTIIRSLGVSTLVALMAAHRAAAENAEPMVADPLDETALAAIEAALRQDEDRAFSVQRIAASM